MPATIDPRFTPEAINNFRLDLYHHYPDMSAQQRAGLVFTRIYGPPRGSCFCDRCGMPFDVDPTLRNRRVMPGWEWNWEDLRWKHNCEEEADEQQ